ncbi:MAG: hypothetical protein WCJ36_02505 [Candidatus Saccharibacteria bacterium]
MVTTAMILPAALILSILILLVLWIRAKNAGWAFPMALVVFAIASLKGSYSLWVFYWLTSTAFWLFISIGAILFLSSRLVGFKRFAIAALVTAFLAAGIVYIGPMFQSTASTKIQPPATIVTTPVDKTAQLAKVKETMATAGWSESDYKVVDIDPTKDQSTGGDGSFDKNGIRDPNSMVTFLKSGQEASNALLGKIQKETDSKYADITNPENWVVIQSNAPFKYTGNTGYKNGTVVNVGSKDGKSGDIFMLFVSPKLDKVTSVRGACANPQNNIPVLTPKSSNINDYQRPGTDNTTDSGTGVKPKVPTVTTPAESSPPVVETTKTGNGGIIDTPTKTPGSETGTTAPGATPPTNGTTPRVIPPVEAGANPPTSGNSDSGTNSGDPGNPF